MRCAEVRSEVEIRFEARDKVRKGRSEDVAKKTMEGEGASAYRSESEH